MKRNNPVRHTVKHFIDAGRFRHTRNVRKNASAKKSNFVRFMESLENRGPLSMHGDLYQKWTKEVRKQMETAGTWPGHDDDASVSFIAEYLSRLLALFWLEFPDLRWYEKRDVLSEEWERLLPCRRVLKKIFFKLKNKGMRDKTYQIRPWERSTPRWTMVSDYLFNPKISIHVRPYTPFNNHGSDI